MSYVTSSLILALALSTICAGCKGLLFVSKGLWGRCVGEAALQLKAGGIPAIRFKQSTRLPTLQAKYSD
ncbi:hypothetical protein [Alteromonas mediterranea]|uniref:hypothetical protein n=1 Tax=Alteromonas mediterranea TaxID=314275 RepID=UPI0012F7E07F|nr:hypothetical protein [Alteromonas mediterranea]QGX62296.1 hypothetical protein FJN15_11225 [Alteromonas mediterranea]